MGAKRWSFFGAVVSVVLHAGVLVGGAFACPPLGATEVQAALDSEARLLKVMAGVCGEREMEEPSVFQTSDGAGTSPGVAVAEAKGPEGKAGDAASSTERARAVFAGVEDNPDPGPAERGTDRAWSMPFWPAAKPYGDPAGLRVERDAIGSAPRDARGNLRGASAADAKGRGGTARAGIGDGGRAMLCVETDAPGATSGPPPLPAPDATPGPASPLSLRRVVLQVAAAVETGCAAEDDR